MNLSDLSTTRSSVTGHVEESASETRSPSLYEQVSELRDRATFVHGDTTKLHHSVQITELDYCTSIKVRSGAAHLLEELSGAGYAWRTIARLVGVSVPAVRNWRIGEVPSPENRRRIAQLAALDEVLKNVYLIEDPAGWIEVPIASGCSTTLADVYEAGRLDLVLDYAAQRLPGHEALLDAFDSQWRSASSEFEVFIDADGSPSSRKRVVN